MKLKSETKSKIVIYIISFVLVLVIFGVAALFPINAPDGAKSQYFCDNHSFFSLDLNVDVEDMSKNDLYNINGEIFALYEDDLTMKNNSGDVVRATDDVFNLISQNNHAIYDGDKVLYHCNGQIKLFADSYEILDSENNKIAHVEFNMFDTVGIMRDNYGNVIARYDSAWLRYDYIVSIFEGCEIDDESVLMIFASYVSDVRADSSS